MEHRNPLLKNAIKHALSPAGSPRLIALCLLTSASTTVLAAHPEWHCQAAADGSGWSCSELNVNGETYTRPQHAQPQATTPQNSVTRNSASKTRQQPQTAAEIDWKPLAELTKQERQDMPGGCCGSYIEPTRSDDEAKSNPQKVPLRATSDNTELLQETTAVMTGNVKLIHGYRQLETDKVVVHQDTNQAELTGNIIMREPGVLITGDTAKLNIDTGEATITKASYLMHDVRLRGDATSVDHQADNVLVMADGSFTRCEPGSETWLVEGDELRIDQQAGQGTGKNVTLTVGGVPIFYTPYIRFPVGDQRQSGFLFPSFSYSGDNGFDLTTPYYLNLAPNYDMTIAPRYIAERGTLLETEFRHLSEYFSTETGFAYLDNDKGGKISDADLAELTSTGSTLTAEDLQPYKGQHRWLVDLNQTGGLGTRWATLVDYTRVSDDDYFRDLSVASLETGATTHLKQLGMAGYRFDHWNVNIAAEEYQTIAYNVQTPYKQLPRINMNGSYDFGNWLLELNNEYISFDHREDFWNDNTNDPRIIGQRVFTDYSLSWDNRWQWGFIKPSAMVKSINYQLDDQYLNADASDNANIVVPQGSLDAGLYFERLGSLFGRSYQQTFEPRLFYFYSDYESHDELFNLTSKNRDVKFDTTELTFSYNSLFRDFRFSGHDRIGDDNRLTAGVTTRFIETATGIERLSASLGQIYYFDDRAITLNYTTAEALLRPENLSNKSEMAAQLSARISDYWQFNSNVAWDQEDNNKVTRGSTSLRYMDDKFRIFNFSYRYLQLTERADTFDIDNDGDTDELINRDIDQGDVSVIWPIRNNWSAIGRVYHDFTNNRELETLAGFEYNSCCYRVRVMGRRWLDNDLANVVDDSELEYDQGIFFEIELKGLGGTGTQVSSTLEDSIYGYQQREDNLK